jgi:hypothetical protein
MIGWSADGRGVRGLNLNYFDLDGVLAASASRAAHTK